MSTMSQLDALLNGTQYLEPVGLSDLNGPEEVLVRPLSDAEAGQVDRIRLKGLKGNYDEDSGKITSEVEDVGTFIEQQHRSRIQTVAFGLSHSGDTCSYDQAAKLPTTWARRLADAIGRISGMAREETFRSGDDQESGNGNAGLRPERHPAQ